MIPVSVLDLIMVGQDKSFADSLAGTKMLAQHVEQHGYKRYWIAEHHDLPGIASSATTLIIQDLAAATSSLRVGAGGIMLPNHSPLMVAESFATLDTLFPGRIDLGVGRAAGAGGATVRALRGDASPRNFELDIQQLTNYLQDNGRQPVRGIPEAHDVPLWILGSSMQSADLAAQLGLPYSFASHFAPRFLMDAIGHYRKNFRPSSVLSKPYVMAGVNVIAADTRAEAEFLASSHFHWVNDLYLGKPGPLPRPEDGYYERPSDIERYSLEQAMAYRVIGDVDHVGSWLGQFISQTGVDELIIDARIYDPVARCRSYQLAAESIAGAKLNYA
jgi:luciferase family oxidoreductase group 1